MPTATRARDCPSRRNAATPNWSIAMNSTSVAATQNVVRYTPAAGPPSRRSGVRNASTNPRTSRSSHSPAAHSESITDVQASAATFPAAPPRTVNGDRVSHQSSTAVTGSVLPGPGPG